MQIYEFIGVSFSVIGVAFGFGRQSAAINTLRKDVDNIANLNRGVSEDIHDISIAIAKIEQRLQSCNLP